MPDPVIVSATPRPILIQPFATTTINNFGNSSQFLTTSYTSNSVLNAYEVVALVNNSLVLASADNILHSDLVVGLARTPVGIGSSVEVVTQGLITNIAWNWSQGENLFLGLDGEIVTLPDFNVGFLLPLGRAVSPTTIILEIDEAELL
ncbi:MAG: hypothetical protein ACRC80_26660 [Waterburya sp.]